MNRNTALYIVLGCLGFILVSCCCIFLAGSVMVGSGYQAVARDMLDPDYNIPITPLPPVEGPLDLQGQMNEIEAQVSAIRGWTLDQPVDRSLQTSEELREDVIADFEEDYPLEEARDDTLVYYMIGLLPRDYDFYGLLIDLYSGGILGYYEPDEDSLYVISDDPELTIVGRSTYAHEYQHAMQDARYDIRALGFSEEGWEEDSERAAAIQALIEGEAEFVENVWRETYFTQSDYNAYFWISLRQELSGSGGSALDLPEWLILDFRFPYEQGRDFVYTLYQRGGWEAIDDAYEDPPTSLEMILHPEHYFDRQLPVVVDPIDLTGLLGDDWREIDSGTMGEWYTYLILREHLIIPDADFSAIQAAEQTAAGAAAGWGGDAYGAYYDETNDQLIMADHFVWDTPADAREFNNTFIAYGNRRFATTPTTGDNRTCWSYAEGYHCLYTAESQSLWVVAPDLTMAGLIAEEIGEFEP